MTNHSNDIAPGGERAPAPPRLGGLSRRAATTMMALGLVAGGATGGFIVSHAATAGSSATSSSIGSSGSPATTTPSSGSSSAATMPDASNPGVFHPNEDPTHEKGESAQREAQENAGQRPTVP